MSDLIKALRKAVEVNLPQINIQESARMFVNRNEALKAESRRLQPLWDKVIAVVEAADMHGKYSKCEGCLTCDALEQLRLAVGEK